ncbi:MAG: 16S rRNA (cytidine(1402)-2'-O)-methyltransferase [Clostridia bacterium]
MAGKLYLVATPIGNLEDITLRAIRILKEVDVIAAEDTRHTLKLLNHLEITKPMISYHRHNEDIKTDKLIEILKSGKNIALVTDAGTPAISDPGEEIVKEALKEDIEVIPVPGACALITALIASGMNTKEFKFIGFLPLNKKNRKEKIEEIEKETQTIILYEAPHKLLGTLEDLKGIVADRKVVLAKELTKIHEEFIRGTIQELLEKVKEPKGEFIILIEGADKSDKERKIEWLRTIPIEEHYQYYEEKGLKKKDIIKQIAKDRKVTKNEIYQKFVE